MSAAPSPTPRWKLALAGFALLSLVSLLLVEVACQIYARTVMFPKWDAVMAEPLHYYQASDRDVLGYELRPNVNIARDGRTLRVNAHGIREFSDDLFEDHWRVAVLGDSVVFGVGQDQASTLSGRLQTELDTAGRRIKVLNFGLSGLNLAEVRDFLRKHDATYDVDEIIYLYNPNDLSPRNSIYEGADNGLWRIYNRPTVMLPWFVRKAVYRANKRGRVSVDWYEWLFAGNEQYGYEHLQGMADYARENDARFSVVLLPSSVAYAPDGYVLEPIHAKLRSFLERADIPYRDPVARYADPERYYDDTDHLVDAGNALMVPVMKELVVGPPTF